MRDRSLTKAELRVLQHEVKALRLSMDELAERVDKHRDCVLRPPDADLSV